MSYRKINNNNNNSSVIAKQSNCSHTEVDCFPFFLQYISSPAICQQFLFKLVLLLPL